MNNHPAIASGNVAVITGAASGIGLAAAKKFAALGMKVCLADLNANELERAAKEVAALCSGGEEDVLAVSVDVADLPSVEKL